MSRNIQYRLADNNDLTQIISLLSGSGLPISDIATSRIDFIIATNSENTIIGCIGVEQFDSHALLRSFAVNKEYRNLQIGTGLYNRLLSYSAQSGILELHLLTTTAERYFASKGFISSKRENVPDSIKTTTEFTSICPSSSAYMSLRIDKAALSYYADIQKVQQDTESQSFFWSINGANLQFTSFDIPANTAFEKHQHDSEQITYVIEGELFFEIEGNVHQLSKGDSIVIPGGKEHKVWTNSRPSKAVDAWSPVNKIYANQNQ